MDANQREKAPMLNDEPATTPEDVGAAPGEAEQPLDDDDIKVSEPGDDDGAEPMRNPEDSDVGRGMDWPE